MGIIDTWDTMLPTLRYIEFSECSYTHVYASDGQFHRDNSECLTNEFPGFSIFKFSGYPLVNCYIAMENHHCSWENPLLMAIFNSYVKLPEGKSQFVA